MFYNFKAYTYVNSGPKETQLKQKKETNLALLIRDVLFHFCV